MRQQWEKESPLSPDRAFVVQFRQETDVEGKVFVGRVEHMSSSLSQQFTSLEDFLKFVDQILTPMKPDSQ